MPRAEAPWHPERDGLREPEDRVQILGDRVTACRLARGWKRRQLAEQAGVAPQTIDAVEAGQRTISWGKLEAIARAVAPPAGADVAYLWRWLMVRRVTLRGVGLSVTQQAAAWYRECAERAAALPLLSAAARVFWKKHPGEAFPDF